MPPKTTINANEYLKILKSNLLQWLPLSGYTIFQHDGAPCHRAKVITKWLAEKNIQVLSPWPGLKSNRELLASVKEKGSRFKAIII